MLKEINESTILKVYLFSSIEVADDQSGIKLYLRLIFTNKKILL